MTSERLGNEQSQSYAGAGVHIEDADVVKARIQASLRTTLDARTLGVGSFGSLYHFAGYEDPVLVSSCDGVGTKLKVASLLGRNRTVGHDIVNHCINDILCCGAMPLFFLDYIAMARLDTAQVADIVDGLSAACREAGAALIGGETAEMPGFYVEGIYDLVGFMVGVVERDRIIDGKDIAPGDLLLGLPSSGLHTNGYSLARKVFGIDDDPSVLARHHDQLGGTLGDALLTPHRPYHRLLAPHLTCVKGLAHITGGGFEGNISRILPAGVAAMIDTSSWPVPALFRLIQKHGSVPREEMYRVFNMGVGMVLVADKEHASQLTRGIPEARVIGNIVRDDTGQRVHLV
ncbi:MAG: phosphoribosylformylglycinamidine cyclo-ligase [Armatimonadetes bacterium]|jgi:phosphoribosylformylglycinamidine cyclo-ligase|nr:phosphoribosylformylglycinamidine cyclo-ligase [Armatimonadota bacterium]